MNKERLRAAFRRINMFLYLLFYKYDEAEKEELRQKILKKGIASLSVYPYSFTKAYSKMNITVNRDEEGKLYIMHHGRKLYGKFDWPEEKFRDYYRSLMIEQDLNSPHCYLGSGGNVCRERYPQKEDILADIGAAEGFFALDFVDKVKKIYLFECDSEWIGPLKRTFQPWLETGKAEIVQKFVGKETRDNYVTLDEYFYGKDVSFIKADIEGAEADMLLGGKDTFRNKIKKALLCAYHNDGDEKIIKKLYNRYGFETDINKGYMIFLFGKSFRPPFFRRGIMFGQHREILQ